MYLVTSSELTRVHRGKNIEYCQKRLNSIADSHFDTVDGKFRRYLHQYLSNTNTAILTALVDCLFVMCIILLHSFRRALILLSGCSGVVVEYRTRNRKVAGSSHNLEQVTNLLCAQANSASYPQRDGKWVVATATRWRPNVADWGDGVSASCTVGPIVR